MLEYWVAAIVIPIRKYHCILAKKIADSEHEPQSTLKSNDSSQDVLQNYNKDGEVINFEQKRIPIIDIHWEGKFKGLEQEIRRMKTELEVMKSQNNTTRRFTSLH